VRRHGQFDACEDAVQEALVAASRQWPADGIPADPRSWLIAVARRRLVDEWRSESARRRREEAVSALDMGDDAEVANADDTLALLFLCCHPSLSPPSQLALTLRAVGGLTTGEIANAFLVPEATMAQRIIRAKQTIKRSGLRFELPPEPERSQRLGVVLHALYLLFNEGYTASLGSRLSRADRTTDAIRVTRMLREALPNDGEVAALLALMLLTDARRAARSDPEGVPIPLAQQDRARWNAEQIAEGIALLEATLGKYPVGPYQLQAAIAAVHDEAATGDETDWPQILALYDVLEQVAPSPVVTLNRAVAVAMVDGPRAGLDALRPIEDEPLLAASHRPFAVRAHLLEMAGELDSARAEYLEAARRTASQPEARYLTLRAARLADADHRQASGDGS
jgi:RNA polymerase sigma factor (sigma-70 family)